MKFKNYRTTPVRACTKTGHTLFFKPFEEKEVPEHLELVAIENGLVPMDDVELIAKREAEQKKAEEAAKKKAAADAAAAKKARSEALKKAADAE